MKLISIHIPKTGGTSLRHAFKKRGRISTYYYNYNHSTFADVLHGHLTASKAREDHPGVPRMAIMRHPYQQIRSNYDHYRNQPATSFEPNIGVLPPNLTFEEFIEYEPIRNYQAKFLDEPIEYVGKLETIEEDLKEVKERFGVEIGDLPVANQNGDRTNVTEKHKEMIRDLHKLDMWLYESPDGWNI